MKKLMFTAAALCATVLVAGTANPLTSSKIVGYVNRDGRAECNFYTPCFEKVDGSKVTIQDVQLDKVEDMGADLQILGADRACIGEAYVWMTADMAHNCFELAVPPEMGAWVDSNFELPDVKPLEPGQVVQVTLPKGASFKSCGQVCDHDVLFHGCEGCNFVGNFYPMSVSIQNIQCDETVGDTDADLQVLDNDRRCIGEAYTWLTPAKAKQVGLDVLDGMGAWVNDKYEIPVSDKLQSGEGVQVTLEYDADIVVYCPFELN